MDHDLRNGISGLSASRCAIEHAADDGTIELRRREAKADNAAGEDVHHDHDPVAFGQKRLATKEVDAPQAVLSVPEDGEPGRTITAFDRSVVLYEYASDDIFIDIDSECSRYLLGNLPAAEAGVSTLHLDNRAKELFRRTFGARATALSRAIEQVILALHQGVMKTQQRRSLQYHSHLAQAFG